MSLLQVRLSVPRTSNLQLAGKKTTRGFTAKQPKCEKRTTKEAEK